MKELKKGFGPNEKKTEGEEIKLHNEELQISFLNTSIIRVTKPQSE
jgi:hypothetical protein